MHKSLDFRSVAAGHPKTGPLANTTGVSPRRGFRRGCRQFLAGKIWPGWPAPCRCPCRVGPGVEWSLHVRCTHGSPAAAGFVATSPYVNRLVTGMSISLRLSRNWSDGGSALWMNYSGRDSTVPNISSAEEMVLSSFDTDLRPRRT